MSCKKEGKLEVPEETKQWLKGKKMNQVNLRLFAELFYITILFDLFFSAFQIISFTEGKFNDFCRGKKSQGIIHEYN